MKFFWWLFKWGKTTALIGIRQAKAEVHFHPTWGGVTFTFTPHAGLLLQENRSAHTLAGINDRLREESEKLFYTLYPLWKVLGGKVIISKGPSKGNGSKFIAKMKLQKSQ